MNNNTSRLVLGMIALLFAGQPQVYAEPSAEAGSILFETCAGCHSKPGYANAVPRFQVPKLGGQQPGYLAAALKAYAAGDRPHPGMRGNAESLSEEDIQNIATYLAGLELVGNDAIVIGDAGLGKEKAVSCAGCHGEDGNSSDQSFPRLAGQYQSYLIKVLNDYKAGVRNNPMMAGMVQGLSEEDIENVSAYYASQAKGLGIVER